ncbi:MAG: hypothetical protein QOF50_391 [Gaiellaceae bacterium]|nr:hypothetical protein [Gaiellaceae bacterium]
MELKETLQRAAARNGRSLNAELVDRLDRSLDPFPAVRAARRAVSAPNRGEQILSIKRLRIALAAGVILAAVAIPVAMVRGDNAAPTAAPAVKGEQNLAPRLLKKLAASQRFAPSEVKDAEGVEGGWAAQDWAMHSQDGSDNGPPPFTAFATARNDWFGLLGRPANGTGKWVPLGPVNGANDLANPFRDRTVYTAGTENFSGRTNAAVVSPDCKPAPADCTMWIAASNGGVWRTDNALAVDDPATPANEGPAWEFISGTFEQQNTSSLELDPNDHKTLWAGTGEPNACGSGCEVGVGIYRSTDQRKGWQGPLGASVFFGRGVGDIQVKPGDSKTLFVATGRATRGISNSCCGGTDALIPGAPHFGVYRSQDAGKSWQLVNQGAPDLCNQTATPDEVSLNQTACSARGARYIRFDPVDPNTIYASFFARGIWRSKANGDPGTWEQIFQRIGPASVTSELPAFDVVALPNGKTRMYVGVGGGGTCPLAYNPPGVTCTVPARFLRSDDVRDLPAAATQASFVLLTNFVANTPGYSSAHYCDPQCSYDNYVYAPANPENAPASGATPDTVYLSGSNQYAENNFFTGRSNGRAVGLSTDGGATFTDMTEDNRDSVYPGALHPDHHALVVNPADWKQFFDLSDGGVNRSDGVFVNDGGDCLTPPHSFAVPARQVFCQQVLSRVPQTLNAINFGLRTLAMYTLDYDRTNPDRLAAGTQDNGSWETMGSPTDWLQVSIADGGPNRFDATGADQQYALTAFQGGQLINRYNPQQQADLNWIADTLADPASNPPYALETSAFVVPAETDPVHAGWLWTGREHVFRSQNYGRNPILATKDLHRANCNIWNGHFADINNNGTYDLPGDACDDWKALGDPSPAGRLTAVTPAYGADKSAGYVSVTQRAKSDPSTLWAATGAGRVFVSKNADAPDPASVVFDRIDNDPTAVNTPPRFVTDIYVDPTNPNHAWITYSGYNAKTPGTPGHVFEVTYAPNASVFVNRDGKNRNNNFGDIPANSIIQTLRGTVYVGTDYGVVVREPNNDNIWKMAAAGLPNVDVADMVYIPQRDVLIAATHGQGAWQLKVQ